MSGWFFGLIWPIAAVFCVLRPMVAPGAAGAVLAAGLAVGLGPGLSGIGLIIWRFVTPPDWFGWFPVVDALVWGAVLLAALRPARWRSSESSVAARQPLTFFDFALATGCAVVAVIAIRYFVLHSIRMPHGEWDAWAVWNLKARFLFLGGSDWTNLFSPLLPHGGYPLMLPGTVARLWSFVGHQTPAAGAIVAALFTFSTPVVVAGALACLRNWRVALWGGLLTLAATPLTFVGSFHIADVPLAWATVATVALAGLAATSTRPVPLATVAWAALAMAGLAKDEGLALMLGMTACVMLAAAFMRTPNVRSRAVGATMFVVASVPAWVVLYAIRQRTPASGLAQALVDPLAIDKIASLERHAQIARAFADTMWYWAGYGPLGVVPIFGAALLLGGYRLDAGTRPAALYAVAVIVVMCASYYVAFVVTPYDLTWHLTSLSRVLVQIWPTFVLLFCLGTMVSDRDRTARDTAQALQPARRIDG